MFWKGWICSQMDSLLLIHSASRWKPRAFCYHGNWGGANGFIFLILLFKWRNVAPLASVRKGHDVGGKCNSKAHFPLALEYFLILVNCLRKSLAYQKVLLSWWWSVQSSNKIYFDELKVPQCPLHCTQMRDCVRIWKSEFFSCACLWIYFLFFPGVSLTANWRK